jgi:diguanylate cyclase (GGDEF)-like protein
MDNRTKKGAGPKEGLTPLNRDEILIPVNPSYHKEERRKTLAEILKGHEADAFLFDSRTIKKKALIALLEDLSPQEQEAIHQLRPLTIELEEDLLEKIIELKEEINQLQAMALIDGLTGLYNNRFFSSQLEKEMARTRRTGLPCTLLIMDLDNFKTLNDTLGHLEGNHFLVAVAGVLRESLRTSDTICRFGGDEFTVIMPATNLYEAGRAADRLIKAVQVIAEPLGLGVSLSAGAGEYTATSSLSLNEFVQTTDSALYEAKRCGKNRLAFSGKAEPIPDETSMVSVEEKEALFALKEHLQQKGEDDDR